MSPLTAASFFSGIGGFDLGFQRAGINTVWQCELNPFCCEILERHWPGVPRVKDIRKVQSEEEIAAIPIADVWAGGFPCQDVSLARMGPRSGLGGKQSGLFFDFARLIDRRRPATVVIENVAGLLSSHKGRDFSTVVGTLAELGYGVAWRVFNSQHFGVPQSRQRVYIVGCYRDIGRAGSVLFESERSQRHAPSRGPNGEKPVSPFKRVLGDSVKGPRYQGLAYCLYACSARHTGTDWSRTYISYPDGRVRRLTPLESERLQGFPDNWTLPTKQIDDADRLDSLRYHAVGNAVTVNVAEWIGRRIVATHSQVAVDARKVAVGV